MHKLSSITSYRTFYTWCHPAVQAQGGGVRGGRFAAYDVAQAQLYDNSHMPCARSALLDPFAPHWRAIVAIAS